MATVHLGRLVGPVGFGRTVAIKRLHAAYARDPDFVSMFLDEARLAARIRHPNVVSVLDVVEDEGELFLVMDLVVGESLSQLVRACGLVSTVGGAGIPPAIAVSIAGGMLQGLHAAHETRGPRGESLEIVHRDVSPQNVLVGRDGVARLIDFGVAKALGRLHASQDNVLKGKLPYMAPEQLRGLVARASDIFAAAVVLWEMLTGRRLFCGETDAHTFSRVQAAVVQPPSELVSEGHRVVVQRLDAIILRALSREPAGRHATAMELALELESAVTPASTLQVAEWLDRTAGDRFEARSKLVRDAEELTVGASAVTVESLIRSLASGPKGALPTEGDHTASGIEPPGSRSSADVPRDQQMRRVAWSILAGTALAVGLSWCAWRPNPYPLRGARPVSLQRVSAASPAPPFAASPAPLSAAPADPAVPAPRTAVERRPALPPPAPRGAKNPPVAPPPHCDPPYTQDANGFKHFKPDCF